MTFKTLRAVMVLMLMLGIASCSFASEASQAINDFAFNAGKIIAGDWDSDFFFSPYSIISAFGMAYAGAKGQTAGEIEAALGLSRDIHVSLGGLVRDLDRNGYVSSANRVWLNEGLKLRRDYTDILRLNYNSRVKELDFKGDTETSRKAVNDWVSAKTNGRIQDLLQTLDPETRMVITNAVYFNAEWKFKFSKNATKPEKFYTDGESYTEIPMMRMREDFSFAEFDGVKVVMLPYKGYRLSMIAVLPPKENPDVLKNIDAETFSHWLDAMNTYDVDLWLPKFRTEKRYELKGVFEAVGVKLAFTNEADFSGMTCDEQLKADQVIHQTFIQVDEERTEAAAATAVPMMMGTAMPVQRPRAEFHADHPFMYFIRDNETGTILFMGYQTFR